MSLVRSYRQAEELQRQPRLKCCPVSSTARTRAEQSGREFPSADQIAGARDETVQISRSRATFSFGLRNHYLTLPSGATTVQSSWLSRVMKSRFVVRQEVVCVEAIVN